MTQRETIRKKQPGEAEHQRFRDILRYWQIYLFLLPAIAYVILFHYAPMYGVQIAFKNYNPFKGIQASEWVGAKYFVQFFESYYFKTIIVNTVRISLMAIVFSFPFPIVFALLLNELNGLRFKRFVQTVTYAPHFISTVVMCGMLTLFLAPNSGLLNQLIVLLGGTKKGVSGGLDAVSVDLCVLRHMAEYGLEQHPVCFDAGWRGSNALRGRSYRRSQPLSEDGSCGLSGAAAHHCNSDDNELWSAHVRWF